jgi:hypothetical protein
MGLNAKTATPVAERETRFVTMGGPYFALLAAPPTKLLHGFPRLWVNDNTSVSTPRPPSPPW